MIYVCFIRNMRNELSGCRMLFHQTVGDGRDDIHTVAKLDRARRLCLSRAVRLRHETDPLKARNGSNWAVRPWPRERPGIGASRSLSVCIRNGSSCPIPDLCRTRSMRRLGVTADIRVGVKIDILKGDRAPIRHSAHRLLLGASGRSPTKRLWIGQAAREP